MKLSDIQKLAINLGIENDLRGEKEVRKHLKSHNDLTNPYPDSVINLGKPEQEVKRILAGIDMGTGEVLLADRLGNIDLIISHHPEGKALAELYEVMHIQSEILAKYGVPINIAESLMQERIQEVSRRLHKGNHYRSVDAAKLLGISFLTAHTVCDNLAATFVKRLLEKNNPQTVGQILEIFKTIPEYQIGAQQGSGPIIMVGSAKRRVGKIAVTEFTGGTHPSPQVFEHLAKAGIGTIIGMHLNDDARKEAAKHHLNVVITGHMSSDSLGMNLFLDQLEKKGVEVIATSGLIRVSRNKKTSRKQ
jgi:putative NIF3 family GTP cyclohydrolase 1 type 2